MNQVLIIKNVSSEGPGLLEDVLKSTNLTYDVVDVQAGDLFHEPETYKAVVVLSGPGSVNDPTLKILEQIRMVDSITAAGIPYLGIGFGLHVLAKANEGNIVPSPVPEVGFLDTAGQPSIVELTYTGRNDPLFADLLASNLKVFQRHKETIELSGFMTLMGTGKFCKNQVIKVGDTAYGIQGHIELTPQMLTTWAAGDPDLGVIGIETLLKQLAAEEPSYTATGKTIFRNFLRIAGLV